MKRNRYFTTLLLLLTGTLFFTGCIIHEKEPYNPTPAPPAGYQYVFNEDFISDTRGWTFDDPIDSAYAFVSNGLYKFADYSYTGGLHTAVVPTGATMGYDWLIQTRLKSDYAMGLIFGASNTNYGYSLFIDEQGYFAVFKEGSTNSPVQTIIDWEYNPAISSGWNDVELEQSGNYWIGYINNTKVFELPSQYLSGTQVGFMVLAGTTGYADYLTVKW